MSSGSVNINGNDVWYETFGTGSHPILLFGGAIGTGRSDFLPQIQGKNALNLNKYTLIAIEPLGWGRSRPPSRVYDSEVFNRDAFCGNKIMETLGFTTYSVMGWSNGAKTALIMSYQYKARITSCIIWGIVTNPSENALKVVLMTRNIQFWGKDLIYNYESVYGDEWSELWSKHMDFLENVIKIFPKGLTQKDLKSIHCPVFVLHGDQDPLVDLEHPLYVTQTVSDSRLHRFPKGSHNLHLIFAKEFKQLVEEFLEEVEDMY